MDDPDFDMEDKPLSSAPTGLDGDPPKPSPRISSRWPRNPELWLAEQQHDQ